MKKTYSLAAICLCLGCRATASSEPKPEASARPSEASTALSLNAALDKLDQRRPVPLLPMMAQHQKANMREHLEAVQEVVAGAAAGEFDKVALAAKRMGYSETMGRMCEHMGASAPGFTEQALSFHHTADEIAAAATKQDGPAVLAALSKTLRACTSCHATYKQRLVASLPE
ncbi:MAG TPA: cytochrome c [Polyangiaceae bacterium]|nr:cytochrome c [Polyangiaceae bacterium]